MQSNMTGDMSNTGPLKRVDSLMPCFPGCFCRRPSCAVMLLLPSMIVSSDSTPPLELADKYLRAAFTSPWIINRLKCLLPLGFLRAFAVDVAEFYLLGQVHQTAHFSRGLDASEDVQHVPEILILSVVSVKGGPAKRLGLSMQYLPLLFQERRLVLAESFPRRILCQLCQKVSEINSFSRKQPSPRSLIVHHWPTTLPFPPLKDRGRHLLEDE